MGAAIDPWHWSINQVVLELCYNKDVWKDHPNAPLPDLENFAQTLRREEIDGVALLSGFTNDELKMDLQIGSLGQRRSIIRLIARLRSRSQSYFVEQTHLDDAILPSNLPDGSRSYHSPHSIHATPRIPYSPYPPMICGTPLYQNSPRTVSNNNDSSAERSANIRFSLNKSGPSDSSPHHDGGFADVRNVAQAASPQVFPAKRQAGVSTTDSATGHKRRRLDLSVHKLHDLTTTNEPAYCGTDAPSPSLITNKSVLGGNRSRRELCGLGPKDASFLGKDIVAPNAVFFGSAGYGKPINPEIPMTPLNEDGMAPDIATPAESAICQFSVHSCGPSVFGRQICINRQMMYFLRKACLDNTSPSKDVISLEPYSSIGTFPEATRSLIVIKEKDGSVIATREKALAEGVSAHDQGCNPDISNDWDYLLSRWGTATDDKVLTLDDMDVDSNSEEERALEQEMLEDEQQARVKNALDSLEVSDLVDVVVTEYILTWEQEKRPIRLEQAYTIWMSGRNTRGRALCISTGRNMIQRLTQRLDALKDNIVKDIWYSAAKIRSQCESLEQTVIQREEERFKIAIWQRYHPPQRSKTTKLQTRKRRELRRGCDSDEHALSSDDDIFDNSGFVEVVNVGGVPQIDLTSSIPPLEDGQEDQELRSLQHVGEASSPNDSLNSEATTINAEDDSCLADSEPEVDQSEVQNSLEDENLDSDSVIGHADMHIVKLEPEALATAQPKRLKYIDLTMDSDLDTCEINRAPSHTLQSPTTGRLSTSIPALDILSCEWDDIEEQGDKSALVTKLLLTMPSKAYARLRNYVLQHENLSSSCRILELGENVLKILKKDMEYEVEFQLERSALRRTEELLHLYICWLEEKAELFRKGYTDPANTRMQLAELSNAVMHTTFSQIQQDRGDDMHICLGKILGVLERHETSLVETFPDEEDEESMLNQTASFTPRRERKRLVAESQVGIDLRNNVKRAREEYDVRGQQFLMQNLREHSNDLEGEVGGFVVNIGKQKDEAAIAVPAQVSLHSQPHQVEGIRFMWREIVGTSDNNEDLQGCLLAHTMGLGKTYQVITFLATLAHAGCSADDSVRAQIPHHLRRLRILVLCPAGLIENWIAEFNKWCGDHTKIGDRKPWTITSELPQKDRMDVLRKWYTSSGVLMMSYGLFKQLALNKIGKKNPYSEDEHKFIEKWLLKGPDIVVADEAHTLKNKNSDIAKAARLLRTKSRIAMTGTPLSNNVAEYFAMVDWIAPDYLGGVSEFNAHYKEPIENGLQSTSSIIQRRTALMRLLTLTRIIDPKIHRKEIKDLEGGLGSKTEFVLKIPPTDVQLQAYKSFVLHATNKDTAFDNTALWAWIGRLQLLCNHPMLFLERLQSQFAGQNQMVSRSKSPVKKMQDREPEEDRARSPSTTMLAPDMEEGEAEDPTTVFNPITEQVSMKVAEELKSMFDVVRHTDDLITCSHKVNILLQLLEKSKEIGDRALVFSQSIPTLRLLQSILTAKSFEVLLMTGSTTMQIRQRMMKDVNDRTRPCDVFLISTRAGGVGINLHGANRVILFDFSFNPTWEQQAIGRAYRLGQKKPVFVYRLISAGCFEEQLLNQANFKTQLAFHVVERKNMKSKASKDGTRLELPILSKPADDLHLSLGKDLILDAILQNMPAGKEIIHQVTSAELLREEVLDELTEEDRKEAEKNLVMEKLRLANASGPQASQSARRPTSGVHTNTPTAQYSALSSLKAGATLAQSTTVPATCDGSPMGPFREGVPVPQPPALNGTANLFHNARPFIG